MTRKAFNAWLAVLLQRWPFDLAEGTTARDFYISRLWAKVQNFGRDFERSFGESVESAVASDRFGRPSIEQLLSATAGRAGPDPNRTPQGLHGPALIAYQDAFWATRRRPTMDDRRKAHAYFQRNVPNIAKCMEHHWPELIEQPDPTESEERAGIQAG